MAGKRPYTRRLMAGGWRVNGGGVLEQHLPLDRLVDDPQALPVRARPREKLTAGGNDDSAVVDLLQDLNGCLRLLAHRVGAGDWLDSFLLCSGAVQILEDSASGHRRDWWRRLSSELAAPTRGRTAVLRALGGALGGLDRTLEVGPLARDLRRLRPLLE